MLDFCDQERVGSVNSKDKSVKDEPSKTGCVPKLRLKGNVAAEGGFPGDWLRKYDSIGELEGEGMLMRWGLTTPEIGVGSSGELVEPDEPDETEAERLRLNEVLMGIGSECFSPFSLMLSGVIFVTKFWKRLQQL